jgi:hypothetical protein
MTKKNGAKRKTKLEQATRRKKFVGRSKTPALRPRPRILRRPAAKRANAPGAVGKRRGATVGTSAGPPSIDSRQVQVHDAEASCEHSLEIDQAASRCRPETSEHDGYTFDPTRFDPLDPGHILFRHIQIELERQLREARAEMLREVNRDLLIKMFGGPRAEQLPRAFVCFSGNSVVLSGETLVASADGRSTAQQASPRRPIPVARIEAIRAGRGENEWDVTPALRDGVKEPQSPANAFGVDRVCVGFSSPIGGALPGVLWALPAPLGLGLTCVTSGLAERESQGLKWHLDERGRIFVGSQEAELVPDARGLVWMTFRISLGSGDLAHAGRMHTSVAEFDVSSQELGAEFLPLPAGTLTATWRAQAFTGLVEQPFVGVAGRPAEDPEEWFDRVTSAVRHRGRAITADDFADLIGANFNVRVREISAQPVLRVQRWRPGVRITIAPRGSDSLAATLDAALSQARAVEQFLEARTLVGVPVAVGPPSIRVPASPSPDQDLWPYRNFLVAGHRTVPLVRLGATWPECSVAEFLGDGDG